jgi:mono/diheme cytochrome c family protein
MHEQEDTPNAISKQLRFYRLLWLAACATAMASDPGTAKSDFTTLCTPCHGESGRGDGGAGRTLKAHPADFTDCSRMSKESDDKVFRVIKEGGASNGLSSEMQPWGKAFDDDEIRGLVAYVRTFCRQ